MYIKMRITIREKRCLALGFQFLYIADVS